MSQSVTHGRSCTTQHDEKVKKNCCSWSMFQHSEHSVHILVLSLSFIWQTKVDFPKMPILMLFIHTKQKCFQWIVVTSYALQSKFPFQPFFLHTLIWMHKKSMDIEYQRVCVSSSDPITRVYFQELYSKGVAIVK